MLESPTISLVFKPNRNGSFAQLTRTQQRQVESQMIDQIRAVVSNSTLTAWLNPPAADLGVMVGGTLVTFDPTNDSMTVTNLRAFFTQLVEAATTTSPTLALGVDPNGPIEPICKVKVDGKHVDEIRCPLELTVTDPETHQSATRAWRVSANVGGTVVETQVEVELQFVAPDPE
ncbi:MAG: hypothetical protein L6Q99_17600 [Planctomycetes bacterium]|nr:hypothetical protein [Planctomycetota bacterium]